MKDYFSHDYNSRNDKKLVNAFMKFGLESIGAYWCIVEMLYEEGGYLLLSEYERITFELRSNNECIKYLLNDSDLFKNDGLKFWSESAIERLKLRSEKSEKARKSIESRWNRKQNTNVIRTNEERNTNKVKESKEKETNAKAFIYSEFYDLEIKISNSDSKYIFFVKFIYGQNETKEKLSGLLSISKQLTFEQFNQLLEKAKTNGMKLMDIVTKIENDKKYWKGKKSLYLTMNNWIENKFIK